MTIDGLPAYSTLEVARHNSINDVWIIVNGKVLDISSWLIEHPGGDVVLLDQAGRDATREFEDVGHSNDARARLDSLVIGTVRPTTSAELRVSLAAGEIANGKGAVEEGPFSWLGRGNVSVLKTVGAASAASAAIIVLAYAVQRYSVMRK